MLMNKVLYYKVLSKQSVPLKFMLLHTLFKNIYPLKIKNIALYILYFH